MDFRLRLFIGCLVASLPADGTRACCPASPSGKPVVNADQSVIILWDAATKTEHFIRQASFKSEADDFGFLIPTPSRPELNESGNEAFASLLKVTAPTIIKQPRSGGGMGCGCAREEPKEGVAISPSTEPQAASVAVLEEKTVAGFHAVVLETRSANDLIDWLKTNGYAFSPEVAAWAKPYVESGWKITALKVARSGAGKEIKNVSTPALRMSFKTDRPLFPYREPDPKSTAIELGAHDRLLRIYFLADAKYQGELTKQSPWTGEVAWANKLAPEAQKKVAEQLKVTEAAGPAQWWLTEFEDHWPYRVAPADLYFSPANDQTPAQRPPIIEYVSSKKSHDITPYALAVAAIAPGLLRLARRRRGITKAI